MKKSFVGVFGWCGSVLLASCAGSQGIEGGRGVEQPERQATPSSLAVEAAYSEAPAEPTVNTADLRSGGPDLELWNSPNFRRWFTESYLAETEIEPRVTSVERDQLQAIFDLISKEEIDKAMAELQKRSGPAASAVFDFTLASLHFQRDELELAAPLYQGAVEKYPKFRRAWRNLALIQFRGNDFSAAARSFTRVLELGGGDGITYGLLGFAYANLENHIAAESAYRMAMLLDPATLDWQMGLARSFFKQQRFADAAAICQALIAENPGRSDLWMLQANAFLGLGRPMDAASNFEVVDSLGGSTAESLLLLGDIYINEQLLDLAVSCYVRALSLAKGGGPERYLRGAKVMTARGELAGTKRLLDALETAQGDRWSDKERIDVLKLRARVALAEGAGDEEAAILEQVVALDPLDGDALLLLGQHAGRGGDPEKAIFYYERAAALEAFEADAKVRHAQVLVGEARYAEALPLLRRAQALKPRDNIQSYLDQVERIAQGR